MIESERLILKPWSLNELEIFATLHADPIVMADQGGPINLTDSRAKIERYMDAYENFGYSRWHLLLKSSGESLGYCGVMPVRRQHPLGDHDEIGWRLFPTAWGNGYATEAAFCAIEDFYSRTRATELYSYTAADNTRSQGVMRKLNLERVPNLDFTIPDARLGQWLGLVWKSSRPS